MKCQVASDLPIARHAEEIGRLLRSHQVIVVAGETGSGKTTQLPKICLNAGRQRIAHTQPRRIAARSVATRIAAEMDLSLGAEVGFQVRFDKETNDETLVSVMTDGILLAQIAQDAGLARYDTIIIDEAHERSLNIDLLLGYLKRLLTSRPDLRVIVTSATIDTDAFSAYFAGAPVIEVSGRSYPVEIRYRPTQAEQPVAVCEALAELRAHGPGDVLVFASGEREIRDCVAAIKGMKLPNTEVVALYARLSASEQQRVFAPHNGTRIICATNIAETSLTVPGIRYVIDPGFARISRYSPRSKVNRLPIEPISKASAKQRAGRCGRIGPGVCIRLYSEQDYDSRPEATEPEIVRTNLASVLLQMINARLGDISDFDFLTPPAGSAISDGMRLLSELGAISAKKRLSKTGKQLARLPIDPRLGRLLVAAARRDCLDEMLVIVSGLAIPDIRERPAESPEAADRLHQRFWFDDLGATSQPIRSATQGPARYTPHTARRKPESVRPADPGGDIAAYLRLWKYLNGQAKELSGNAFRRKCKTEHLHYLRFREWQDLRSQLDRATRELGWRRNRKPADIDTIIECVCAGFLSHVGAKQPQKTQQKGRKQLPAYQGARGISFQINPGSSCFARPPELVVAIELVDTTKVWARTVAPVTADQLINAAGQRVHRTVGEPYWSMRAQSVLAPVAISLFGVPLSDGATTSYAKHDPEEARRLFIEHALVAGEWRTHHSFWKRNQRIRARYDELWHRTRGGVQLDDAMLFQHYDAVLGEGVYSRASFDNWWRKQTDKNCLDLDAKRLKKLAQVAEEAFPSEYRVGEHSVTLDYRFDPGTASDGVTVDLDLLALNQVPNEPFTWHVPGVRRELAAALIKTLPKRVRRQLVPAAAYAESALDWLEANGADTSRPFWVELSRALRAVAGVEIQASDWNPDALPRHLELAYRVFDGKTEVASGTDLAALKNDLTAKMTTKLSEASHQVTGATEWDFCELPVATEGPVLGYPAVVDEGTTVGVITYEAKERAERAHRRGIRRLVALTTPDPTNWVISRLSNAEKLPLANSSYASVPELLADIRLAAIGRNLARELPRSGADFATLIAEIRSNIPPTMLAITQTISAFLLELGRARSLLDTAADEVRHDVAEQLDNLSYPGFVAATPSRWLDRLPVWARATTYRLERNPVATALGDQIVDLEAQYAELCARQPQGELPEAIADVGYWLEELRVSWFAQQLGTRGPISAKRFEKMLADCRED